MKKQMAMTHRVTYTGDGVIERGYEIYDEWNHPQFTSKRIVRFVEDVLSVMQTKGTARACVEALACLFALDMHIRETYPTPLRRILSYGSYRRETRVFNRLKGDLRIPEEETDIRTVIEVELQKLRERLTADDTAEDAADDTAEDAADDDDTTHGGKHTGGPDEAAATEEKQQDSVTEEVDTPDDILAEEAGEGKSEEKSEPAQTEEKQPVSKESSEGRETAETPQKESDTVEREATEPTKQDGIHQQKQEYNGSVERGEPSTDKTTEAPTAPRMLGSIDAMLLFEEASSQEPTEKISFIDEMILDNMVKGVGDAAGHAISEGGRREGEAQHADTSLSRPDEGSRSTDKDAFLYESMATENGETMQRSEEGSAAQTVQTTQNVQNAQNTPNARQEAAIKNEFENLRIPLRVDITADQENDMRRGINDTMTENMIKEFYNAQAAAMREQLNIASAELGIDTPVEIIGRPESAQVATPSNTPAKK